MKSAVSFIIMLFLLAGCANFRGPDSIANEQPGATGSDARAWSDADRRQASRYQLSQDRGSDRKLTAAEIKEETPFWEPPGRAGNQSPYQVRGRTYHVLPKADGFVEEGIASWYGKKFHGHKTSNGEIFDMYRISAAHTRLPLPTWVRVTNLENNKSIVARVNDRGPFHPDRVIDLSYAAAVKLDMERQGMARVRVEALNLPRVEHPTHELQIAAFSQLARAREQQQLWQQRYPNHQVRLESGSQQHRLRIGPMGRTEAESMQAEIHAQTGDRPLLMRSN